MSTPSIFLAFLLGLLLYGRKEVVHGKPNDIVNELELINHELIAFPGESIISMEYEISDVRPLVISNGEIVTVSFKTLAPNKTDFIAA